MEEWRDIPDFPNYQVSNLGNVRNKKRNNILKARPIEKNYGYICYDVCLYNNTQKLGFHKKIHRLVAEVFIPNPDNKTEIDHIDKNSANNKVENLRWATRSENCLNTKTRSDNTSGERNIYFCKQKNKWTIKMMVDKKETSYGFYDTFEDAKKAKESGCYHLMATNTGEKHIHYNASKLRYVFEKITDGIRYRKSFKTVNEAIKARDEYFQA